MAPFSSLETKTATYSEATVSVSMHDLPHYGAFIEPRNPNRNLSCR
jgi:hypothetical protein